jgi:hypothetical protein
MNRRITRITGALPIGLLVATALAACGGGDSAQPSADAETENIAACNLVTKADVEAVTGSPVDEPDEYSSGDYSGGNSLMSSCAYDNGVLVRAWHPYRAGESTSAAWTAKVQAERDESVADETDPDLRAALQEIELQPVDDLGAPAALEDMREGAGMLALHVYASGKGGVYFSVYAFDPETARAVTEKALAKLR